MISYIKQSDMSNDNGQVWFSSL